MYSCYNEAVKYLNDKYGTYPNGNLKTTKTKPNGDVVSILSHDDLVINTLLGQYYFGISAKKELYYKLIHMGIMKEKELTK